MKKSTMLAFTAALLMSAASITGHAASAPTYDDNLILPNPASAPGLSNVVLVPVASPQVVQSLHDYVKAWENAEQKIALAEAKRNNHEQLTKADKKWLHSKDKHNYADYFRTHSLGRVHGFETALNWNGENRNKYNEKDGFVNSYGYNVLRGMVDRVNEVVQKQKQVGGPMTDDEAQALEDAILDILAQEQEHVSNEELRHYMNETVKNKASEEPTAADEHIVDLRKAINEPMGSNDYNKVDLRSAIQQ